MMMLQRQTVIMRQCTKRIRTELRPGSSRQFKTAKITEVRYFDGRGLKGISQDTQVKGGVVRDQQPAFEQVTNRGPKVRQRMSMHDVCGGNPVDSRIPMRKSHFRRTDQMINRILNQPVTNFR